MTQAQLIGLSNLTDRLALCLIWATLTGLVVASLCCCVAYGFSVLHSSPDPARHRRRPASARRREAARGITEIEAFLAAIPASGPSR